MRGSVGPPPGGVGRIYRGGRAHDRTQNGRRGRRVVPSGGVAKAATTAKLHGPQSLKPRQNFTGEEKTSVVSRSKKVLEVEALDEGRDDEDARLAREGEFDAMRRAVNDN